MTDGNEPLDGAELTQCWKCYARKVVQVTPKEGRPFEICMVCEHRVFKA